MKTKAFVFLLVLLALAAIGGCRNAAGSTDFYTVTFDSNGGGEEPVYIQVKSGQTVPGYQIPADMEHDEPAYTFNGWNTRKNGTGKEFDEGFVITGDITVYAQWKKTTEYSIVEFDPNRGVLDNEAEALIEIEKGTNLGSRFPSSPARAGYTFIEWNTRRNGNGDSFTRTTVVTVDITVYAIWEGGGHGDFVAVTGITGVPTAATVNTPLTLSGTVQPAAATNRTIVWSVQDAGTTGASINGGTLTATAEGTVSVRATIANGTTEGTAFTRDFSITVTDGGGGGGGGDEIPTGDYTVNLSGKVVKNTTPITGNYDETGPKVVLNLPAAFDISGYTKISIKAKFYDSGNALIDIGEPASGTGYGKGQAKILVDASKPSYESPNPIDTIQNLGKQNGSNPSAGTVQCPISWTTKPAAILAQAGDSAVKYIEITEITFHR
jgi:uncharacterized repeat protein (TIGR02543 family)